MVVETIDAMSTITETVTDTVYSPHIMELRSDGLTYGWDESKRHGRIHLREVETVLINGGLRNSKFTSDRRCYPYGKSVDSQI